MEDRKQRRGQIDKERGLPTGHRRIEGLVLRVLPSLQRESLRWQ